MSKEITIELVKHKSAKSVVMAWARMDFPKLSDSEILEQDIDFVLKIGETEIESPKTKDMIKAVRDLGHWGFCNHTTKTHKDIHYWIGKKSTDEEIMNFLSHEVAHALGYNSEKIACKIGAISVIAYGILRDEFLPEINKIKE